MAKKFNNHFWMKFYREWVKMHKRGATVEEFTKAVGKMLAQEESDPLPPPGPPPPPLPDDEP